MTLTSTKKSIAASAIAVAVLLSTQITAAPSAAALSGTTAKSAAPAKVVVLATVEGQTITSEELQARIKNFPAEYAQAFQQKENRLKVLEQLIDEKVLLIAAKKQGIQNTEAYKKQVQNLQDQLLFNTLLSGTIEKNVKVTDAEARQYYTNNPQQFQELEERKASHILVKTEEQAKDVLKKLQEGGDFATLAKQNSLDNTAANGGELGWVSKGQMVPEFEKATFETGKGSISGVVKTQFGFHIVKVEDIRVRPQLTFEQVQSQIKDALLAEKKRVALADYLANLKKTYKIKETASNI